MPTQACLQRQGKGGAWGPGLWGGGAVAPKPTCWVARPSPSPLAPQLMEKPWLQASGPSLAPAWPGLPVSQGRGQRLPLQQAARAAPPTVQQIRASSMQQWLQLPPAPDCGPSRVQDRAQGTDVLILWLWTSFLEKIIEPVFLNPPLSGEKRRSSLLWSWAPGCLPCLGVAALAAHPYSPCLCLAPVQSYRGEWVERGWHGSSQPLPELPTLLLAFSGCLARRKWSG